MMTMQRSMAVLGLVLSLAGCSAGSEHEGQWPLAREDLERNAPSTDPAELTYRRYCIGCHGVDGRGNGGVTGADLTHADGPFAHKADAELAVSVRDGRRGATATMPAHKPVLSEAQIAAVVAYARERFAPPAGEQAATPAAPAPAAASTP